MPKIYLVSIALVSIMLAGCATRSQQADGAFWKEHFVFISSRNGANDIYLSDLSGKNIRALTNDATDDATPRVGPDGRIVFASRRTGSWQIYSMDWDGSKVQALTQEKGVNNYHPYPAPDGRVVFVTDRFLKPQLMSIRSDGTGLVRLTHTDDYYDYPFVNEDGHIYCSSSRSSKWEVWKMQPDGSAPQQLTHTTGTVKEVIVVPNPVNDFRETTTNRTPYLPFFGFYTQPKIIYSMQGNTGKFGLYRMNLDGSDARVLSRNQLTMERSPVLSPDGRILFTSDRAGNTDIWSMSPDGYDERTIVEHPAYDSTS